MSPPVNSNFTRLIETINAMGAEAHERASETEAYRGFVTAFPLDRLTHLSADEYCMGKGANSFSWWLERGLVPALGRYSPGTARGHIVYFRRDGALYKNRYLQDLSDDDALRYTLKIQSAIAAADLTQDCTWVDDDREVFRRAAVEPRVTVTPVATPIRPEPEELRPSTAEKLARFVDSSVRIDVHALSFKSNATGRSGQAPACQERVRFTCLAHTVKRLGPARACFGY